MKKIKVFEGRPAGKVTSIIRAMEDNTKFAGKVEAKLAEKYGSEYKEKFGSDDFADIFYELDKNTKLGAKEKSKYDSWMSKQVKRLGSEYPEVLDELYLSID